MFLEVPKFIYVLIYLCIYVHNCYDVCTYIYYLFLSGHFFVTRLAQKLQGQSSAAAGRHSILLLYEDIENNYNSPYLV